MKTVSIALGTYNGAAYIADQINSLFQQTVLPCELIVADDGSTDNTLSIVESLAINAPFPIRIEKNPKNLGYRANFMNAASLCKGELIAFCDQDDVWLPTKLEKCLAAFADDNVMMAYHNATVTDDKLNPIGTLDDKAAPRLINPPLSINPVLYGLGFTLMFRRELLAFNHLWPASSHHYEPNLVEAQDQWFFFLAQCLGTVVYIPEKLALYRRHGKNASGGNYVSGFKDKLNVLFSNNLDTLVSREKWANHRASVMEWGTQTLDDRLHENTRQAALAYRKLKSGCALRRQMYATRNLLSRLPMLIAVWRQGGYQPACQWGSGTKALIRDILRGIIVPMHVPMNWPRNTQR